MIKIFLGGSRKISFLSNEIKNLINEFIINKYSLIIGDANGIDKAIQKYLNYKEYEYVEIYCMEGYCRNNIGNWPIKEIHATNKKKDFDYFSTKDKKMAKEASFGTMIWDGKSFGTIANIYNLIKENKKVYVFLNFNKEFISINNIEEWDLFLSRCSSDVIEKLNKYFMKNKINPKIKRQNNLFQL